MEYEENEFIVEDERRYIVLVIYDITENKRRNRMVKCLERYGVRVQRSAFEAFLTKKKYECLVGEAQHLIDGATDSLRIYLLASHTMVQCSLETASRMISGVVPLRSTALLPAHRLPIQWNFAPVW